MSNVTRRLGNKKIRKCLLVGETVSISRWSRKLGCEKKSGWRGGYEVMREDVSRWEISVHEDAWRVSFHCNA